MLIQLPNDAESVGYKTVRPFHIEQVFTSKSANFTGTEREFYDAGKAEKYIQLDKNTRRVFRKIENA